MPSQLLREGDTFDLLCMDVAGTWQLNQHKLKTGQAVETSYDIGDYNKKMEKLRNG